MINKRLDRNLEFVLPVDNGSQLVANGELEIAKLFKNL